MSTRFFLFVRYTLFLYNWCLWDRNYLLRMPCISFLSKYCMERKINIIVRPYLLAFFILFFFFCLLGLHPQHMEVPRLGVESELQLLTYTTATATWDLSHVLNLYPSSQQHRILKPLSEARDRTCNLMVPSRIHFCCASTGTPSEFYFVTVSRMDVYSVIGLTNSYST